MTNTVNVAIRGREIPLNPDKVPSISEDVSDCCKKYLQQPLRSFSDPQQRVKTLIGHVNKIREPDLNPTTERLKDIGCVLLGALGSVFIVLAPVAIVCLLPTSPILASLFIGLFYLTASVIFGVALDDNSGCGNEGLMGLILLFFPLIPLVIGAFQWGHLKRHNEQIHDHKIMLEKDKKKTEQELSTLVTLFEREPKIEDTLQEKLNFYETINLPVFKKSSSPTIEEKRLLNQSIASLREARPFFERLSGTLSPLAQADSAM